MIASPSTISRPNSTSATLLPPLQIPSHPSSISRTGLRLSRPHSVTHLFFTYPHAFSLPPKSSSSPKPLNLVMQWQDCKVKLEMDVPTSVAYKCYSDRESMPQWLPFVSSVKILEDQQQLSQMYFKYNVLGQDIELSLLARNLQPIPNQKIHWRSVEGLPNRGAVRFYPRGPSSCLVELTVSYEVPQILAPVASVSIRFRVEGYHFLYETHFVLVEALTPFMQGLLLRGLESFSRYAEGCQQGYSPSSSLN